MRRIVLYPVYYLIITPIGLLLRLVHDPLHRAWDPQADTYLTRPRSHGR